VAALDRREGAATPLLDRRPTHATTPAQAMARKMEVTSRSAFAYHAGIETTGREYVW
jgi:hypothetical protein